MENLKSLIKIKLLEKKWSERHFIKDVLQMPMSSYYDFLKAKNPRIDVLKNISAALEIPLSSLLNETDNVNSQEPSIPFGLSRYHTLYGFRHTIISQLIKNGADRYEVMKYTGHTTLSAFEKYIKSIFAEPPKDLSDKITVVI